MRCCKKSSRSLSHLLMSSCTVMVRVSMVYQARINRVKVSVRFRVRFRFSDRLT